MLAYTAFKILLEQNFTAHMLSLTGLLAHSDYGCFVAE